MATKKAIIKLGEDILIPITRGEVVLDSLGGEAFHSYEFVASETKPGLLTPLGRAIISKALISNSVVPISKIIQVLKKDDENNDIDVYPITKAEAVIVTVDNTEVTLDTVINLVLDMDDYPTEGSTKAVTSGGVWLHVDDTVGEIHRNVIRI